MSVWITLEMTVSPGKWEELRSFLAAKLPAVRSFDGALGVSVHFDKKTGKLLILEEWKSQAHHQAYIASITQNGVMDQLVSFMTAPPDVQYYERVIL